MQRIDDDYASKRNYGHRRVGILRLFLSGRPETPYDAEDTFGLRVYELHRFKDINPVEKYH